MPTPENDLRAVARAYLHSCRAGQNDHDAYLAALDAFRARHATMSAYESVVRVRRLIADANDQYGLWKYRTATSSNFEDED